MKKIILFSLLFVLTFVTFGQDASAIDQSVFDGIYSWITAFIPAKTLTGIVTVCWLLEYVVTYVKWTPANSTAALVWNGLKKVIQLVSLKKK